MALEDPFFVVKDEVLKALQKTREIYDSWKAGVENDFRTIEEQEWAATELRNSLRSIEWDLEDLEDTIQIVEKNPGKFRIENQELNSRKMFIQQTKDEINLMKSKAQKVATNGKFPDVSIAFESPSSKFGSILSNGTSGNTSMRMAPPGAGSTKYSRLSNDSDSPVGSGGSTSAFLQQQHRQQEQLLLHQDRQLEMMSNSMGNLRSVSNAIGSELDEQAVMLDEYGAEIENAETKLDATMRKMAKVLHMSNDRRQWMAIGVLSSAMVVIIIMIFAL